MERGYYKHDGEEYTRVHSAMEIIRLYNLGQLYHYDGLTMDKVDYLDTYNLA